MATLTVSLPANTTICDGKQITFKAPSNCSGVTGIIINDVTYNLVDALGNAITSGNSFASGSMVSVIIDTTANKAFLQNSATVTKLTTARTIRTNLTSTSTASFDGSTNITPGVTGTLPIANGGTGATTASDACNNLDAVSNTNMGVWKPNEKVAVGDIRYLGGRKNAGIVLECIEAGTTGTEQPTVSDNTDNIIANFTSNDRIGHMRLIFNLAEKDVDEVIALGIAYNRTTYSELWKYVQARPNLLLTEEEWQAKYTETNGKFVPYYSSGNGTSTFRTPLLNAYPKGTDSVDNVGSYLSAGLPNITGELFPVANNVTTSLKGAFYCEGNYKLYVYTQSQDGKQLVKFSANKSNSIYGNSDTVQPESMIGIWVIKAFGIVTNNGNADLSNILSGITELENKVSVLTDTSAKKDLSNLSDTGKKAFFPSTTFVTIPYPSDKPDGYMIAWTAPDNGYIHGFAENNNKPTGFSIDDKDMKWSIEHFHEANELSVQNIFPVFKGHTYAIWCYGLNSTKEFRFYYLNCEV